MKGLLGPKPRQGAVNSWWLPWEREPGFSNVWILVGQPQSREWPHTQEYTVAQTVTNVLIKAERGCAVRRAWEWGTHERN